MTLLEALVTIAVLAVLLAGAAAAGADALGDREGDRAARAVAGQVRMLHGEAIARGTTLGLGLEARGQGGRWTVTVLEDGDGDGIRRDDVVRGIDTRLEGPLDFEARFGAGAPGFHPALRSLRSPPPVSAPLGRLDDPVRFGSADVITCSSRGRLTSGTLYLTDGKHRQFAMVVYGSTGRVRTWEYDLATATWRQH